MSPGPKSSAPFCLEEFNELVSNALDFDIPSLNFAPSKFDLNSNPFVADLESYRDSEEELFALDHPFLNLDDLAVTISPPGMPTFIDKVRSKATALVRRGKLDFPSPTLDQNLSLSMEDVPRSRTKSFSLPSLHTRSTIPTISAPIDVQQPSHSSSSSSRSLFERDTHFPFSEPCMNTNLPRIHTHRSKSDHSLPFIDTTFKELPPCPPLSPYTSPRTPPFPITSSRTSPVPSPSADYLNTRRGSDASTASTVSHSASVKSTTSTLTSRISSSFSRLAMNKFSRSRSKLAVTLTLDTSVVASESSSASMTCYSPYSPVTPRTPTSFVFGKPSRHVGLTPLITYREDLAEDSFTLGRVLTPDDDPFALIQSGHADEGHCSDTRSETPTLLSPGPMNYSFPPTPVSQCFSAKPSPKRVASAKASPSRHSPPKGPPPSEPLPKLPPPKRSIPPTPRNNEAPDWTLSLSSPTSPVIRKKSMSLSSRGKASSSQFRPSSPFPLVGDKLFDQNAIPTPPELEPLSPADEFARLRCDSDQSTGELQSDAEWPLLPKRTITVGETTTPDDGSIKRGRSLSRGWHDIEPTSEFFSPKSPRVDRRHSIRFPKQNNTRSPRENVSPSSNGSFDNSSFPSPSSQSLNDQQLKAITRSFSSPKGSDDDYFSAEDYNSVTPLYCQSRTSLDSSSPLARKSKPRHSKDSSDVSFHSAKSKPCVDEESSTIPYSWNGVDVVTSNGHWEIWLLGMEGFLDGEEDGEVKVLAPSWRKLMEFCAAHERVVVGRNAGRSFTSKDPVVLRVRLAERGFDGMELTLSLERCSRRLKAKRSGPGAALLALQLPTPTTLGEVARFCKKGSVGQGA